jgi:ComF family protein
MLGRRAGRGALALVYPPRCPVTDEPVTVHGAFSPAVWSRAQMIAAPMCQACGLPFALRDPAAPLCVPCAAPARYRSALTGRGRLDAVRSALRYDHETAPLILSLKYGDRHDHVPALARLMALAGDDVLTKDAVLVPVPLHWRRLAHRRFNQAGLLAERVARLRGLQHEPMALRRRRATPKQKGLSPAGRARNVQGAFEARGSLSGSVVLVDDVLTSGATLIACARAARKAGAERVSALTLARVIRG